jgi:hypothetical protein
LIASHKAKSGTEFGSFNLQIVMKTTVALLLIVWFVALYHGAGSAVAWIEGGNNSFPTKYNYLHRHSVLEDSNGDL